MTRQALRLLFVLSLIMTACQDPPVKVWKLDVAKQGLIRQNEIMSYRAGDGYFCVSPKDFETLLNLCKPTQPPGGGM